MRRTSLLLFGATVAAGCQSPAPRINAPPHGAASSVHDMQGTFVYMGDNALLADMTVADVHFRPHRAELTTLGSERVRRLKQLIDEYGGTIRVNSNLTDKELLEKRLEAVRAYLGELGAESPANLVVADIPGGAGMDAAEAILIRAHEGTYVPGKKQTTGGESESLMQGSGSP